MDLILIARDGFDYDFKHIHKLANSGVVKALRVILNIIRADIDDGMFPDLNRIFLGSELLRKLCMFHIVQVPGKQSPSQPPGSP